MHLFRGSVVELRLRLPKLGIGLIDRRLGRRDVGFGDRPRAGVEESRVCGDDRRDNRALGDSVSRLQVEPHQLAGDRRRNGEYVLDATDALVLDGNIDRMPRDLDHVHCERPRPHRPGDGGDDEQGDNANNNTLQHDYSLVLSTATMSSRLTRRRMTTDEMRAAATVTRLAQA